MDASLRGGEEGIWTRVEPNAEQPKLKKTDALIGSVVDGKYRILSLVASGGMGKIYKAQQIALDRVVAFKVLRVVPDGDGEPEEEDPVFKRRFLREASILAHLQHPNIVTVFDYGAFEAAACEQYFIAMEYLSGVTLAKRIAEGKGLSTPDTVHIGRQIARGLGEAHAAGVIHRDLKPSNVMLLAGRDGEELVKIVDFGIVKLVGNEAPSAEELTRDGAFVGSPRYAAPEQVDLSAKIDARADIYSFGVMIYECLTGVVPFNEETTLQTLMAHVSKAPPPMRERAPTVDIPAWLEQLVMSCLEKDPDRRPQTMDIVARMLAEAKFTPTLPPEAMNTVGSSLSDRGVATTREAPGAVRPDDVATVGGSTSAEHTLRSGSAISYAGRGMDRPRTRRLSVVQVGIAAAAITLCAVAFLGLAKHGRREQAVVSAPQTAASVPLRQFTVRIESAPSAADVREGDRLLGTTPLELSIDNDAVLQAPRTFLLSKEGFAPYSVVQGASADRVRIVAQLVPLATASASAAQAPAPGVSAGGHRGAERPQPSPASRPQTATSAARPSSDLDIRTTR